MDGEEIEQGEEIDQKEGGWHGSGVDAAAECGRVARMFALCAEDFPELVEDLMADERLDPLDGFEDFKERLLIVLDRAWQDRPGEAALERAAWMSATVASAFAFSLRAWNSRMETDPETEKAVIREDAAGRLRPLADTVTAIKGVGSVAGALAALGEEFAQAIASGTATVTAKGRTTLTDEVKLRVKEALDGPRKTFSSEGGLRLRQLPAGAYALTHADFTGRVEAAALHLRGEREEGKGTFGKIRKAQAIRFAQMVLARRESDALITGDGDLGSWLEGAFDDFAADEGSAQFVVSLYSVALGVSSDARRMLAFLVRHAAEIRSPRLFERAFGLTEDALRELPDAPTWWGKPETVTRLKAVAEACAAALEGVGAKSGGFVSNLPSPTRTLAWGAVEILDSLRPEGGDIYPELVEQMTALVTAMVTDDVGKNYSIRNPAAKEAVEVWQSSKVKAGGLARATDEWRIRQLEARMGARI